MTTMTTMIFFTPQKCFFSFLKFQIFATTMTTIISYFFQKIKNKIYKKPLLINFLHFSEIQIDYRSFFK
jgi:hypothetical protein